MTTIQTVDEQRDLAERAIAAAEARMLDASGNPLEFERARAEHDAARLELERVGWNERRAAAEVEAEREAAIQRQVEQMAADGAAALAEARSRITEVERLADQLVDHCRELAALRRTLSGVFDGQVILAGQGRIPRATVPSSLPIRIHLSARVAACGKALAKASGHGAQAVDIKSSQARI